MPLTIKYMVILSKKKGEERKREMFVRNQACDSLELDNRIRRVKQRREEIHIPGCLPTHIVRSPMSNFSFSHKSISFRQLYHKYYLDFTPRQYLYHSKIKTKPTTQLSSFIFSSSFHPLNCSREKQQKYLEFVSIDY